MPTKNPHRRPRKLMGKSRPSMFVRWVSMQIPGRGVRKVENIANKVIRQLGFNYVETKSVETLLRKDAHRALKKRGSISALHCVDRSNLALSMIRGAGINAWLVRAMDLNMMSAKWEMHDYVEFFVKGKVSTLVFGESYERGPYFDILEGPAHKALGNKDSVYFRGADSGQIGGVVNYSKFKKFARKFDKNPGKEIAKESKRQDLLVKSGIIPKKAMEQIRA